MVSDEMTTDRLCRLCLAEDRALTFEHIPPRSALNNHEPVRVCRRLVYVSPAVLAGVFWW